MSEPMERWVVVDEDGDTWTYKSKQEAQRNMQDLGGYYGPCRIVHMVEAPPQPPFPVTYDRHLNNGWVAGTVRTGLRDSLWFEDDDDRVSFVLTPENAADLRDRITEWLDEVGA